MDFKPIFCWTAEKTYQWELYLGINPHINDSNEIKIANNVQIKFNWILIKDSQ